MENMKHFFNQSQNHNRQGILQTPAAPHIDVHQGIEKRRERQITTAMVILVTGIALKKFLRSEDCALCHVKEGWRVKRTLFPVNNLVFHRSPRDAFGIRR